MEDSNLSAAKTRGADSTTSQSALEAIGACPKRGSARTVFGSVGWRDFAIRVLQLRMFVAKNSMKRSPVGGRPPQWRPRVEASSYQRRRRCGS